NVAAGLRGLAVNASGKRLFVAAPARTTFAPPPPGTTEAIHVIGVDPGNAAEYLQELAALPAGTLPDMEPYAVTATNDPNIVTFTNRRTDSQGFSVIHGADGNVGSMTTSSVGFTLSPPAAYQQDPLFAHTDFDSFDVNNAQGIAYLPAGALA